MGLRNLTAVTREWSFATAQTDALLVTVAANQHLEVFYCQVTCANSNTGDVSCRIGCATATLPTLTNDALTGGDGIVLSHGGIAKGGGAVVTNGGAPVTIGAADADLRITCSAATGGSIRVVVQFRIVSDDGA